MTSSRPVDLVLLWHMHQPDFRDGLTGEFRLPWVYLHAFKDYSDMAAHLERHPRMRAVVNFVPVLLDQLEDYADQFATGRLRDPLLRFLARERFEDLTDGDRAFLLDRCFRANHEKMVTPFPAYRRLKEFFAFADAHRETGASYLSGHYFSDLVTWYHLAWSGETVRRSHPAIARLMAKAERFDAADRRALLDVISEVVRDVIPRWQRLAASGQVEISSTPHYHPIGPLMLDFTVAREVQPDARLPAEPRYPGGRHRLVTQIEWARESHARRFGQAPTGFWAAEGALSTAFVAMLGEAGVGWTASGEGVLRNSLQEGDPARPRAEFLYEGYRVADGSTVCFFRDDHLSDLIGFEYSRWHGRDAAAHFVGEIARIANEAPPERTPLVSVILDGENAWEYYPYNGFFFLDDLYALLEEHPAIRATTYAEVVGDAGRQFGQVERLVAGSWVYGNLSTWIGDRDKNRAWDLLCEAKRSYDLVTASGRLDAARLDQASRQLGVCEGSDWCWWFGDYNPPESVADIDTVYRANLARLYELLELPAPPALSEPVSRGGGHDGHTVGAMRRSA